MPASTGLMQHGFNPSCLHETVLKRPNSQWEIFRILAQGKLSKLKNKVILRALDREDSVELQNS